MIRTALLLLAFAAAVALRVVVGGRHVAQSQGAGLLFAGCLLALVLASGTVVPVSRRAFALGLAGGLVVCLPVGLERLLALQPLRGSQGFATWALVVTVVATTEELFLRGALYDAVESWLGPTSAIVVGAVSFALLHVPLYGWQVLPLDLAVGLVLGGLRQRSGTPLAPAITHVSADLVGWFLR